MRSNKELLDIFLNNQKHFETGICKWVMNLWWLHLISSEEKLYLLNLIDNNPPIFKFKYYFYNPDKIIKYSRTPSYYWKTGFINPRIKWLKKYLKDE